MWPPPSRNWIFLLWPMWARTADVPYADMVIPLATSYEVDHPFQAVPGWLMATNRVIEPIHSFKSVFEFFIDLGVAMGYGNDF